jgi:hypothetical protein
MASNKNDLLALIANLYPDNGTGAITPAKLRQGLEEMISSDVNMSELAEQFMLGAIKNILLRNAASPNPDPAYQEGLVFWDDTEKALSYYNEESDTKINCGQEIVIKVLNNNGATITNGQAVVLTAAIGGVPTVVRALADSIANATASGIATHDIPVGETGYVTRIGKVSDVDTSLFAAGDILYVSDVTPGALTNIPPAIASVAATVLTSSVTGQIFTATSRLEVPVAIGQLRSDGSNVTQAINTTPQQIEGYGNAPFSINTNVQAIASGNGFRGTFSPSPGGFSGYYEFNGTVSITSTANTVIFLEAYVNGAPSGLISAIDLSNNNIDSGSAAISTFTEAIITEADLVEVYVYTAAGTSTITINSLGFNMKRLGLS